MLNSQRNEKLSENNPLSPVAVRQPDVQTTWPFSLPPPSPLEHCAGRSVGTAGTQERAPLPCGRCCWGGVVTELTPFFLFQAGVSVLILKPSPRENTLLFKFFKTTTNSALFTCFLFWQRNSLFFFFSFLKGEVNRGWCPKFVTWFARILCDASPLCPLPLAYSSG